MKLNSLWLIQLLSLSCYLLMIQGFTFNNPSIITTSKTKKHFKSYASVDDDLSLGAPRTRPQTGQYISPSGVVVDCNVVGIPFNEMPKVIENLIDKLNDHKGGILTSSYEFPGRYARWTVGFTSPMIEIEGKGMNFEIRALNSRGEIVCDMIEKHLQLSPELFQLTNTFKSEYKSLSGTVIKDNTKFFQEEERSRQPSLFSLIREIRKVFSCDSNDIDGGGNGSGNGNSGGYEDRHLGLYGAFGYDLTYQFEPVDLHKDRPESQVC